MKIPEPNTNHAAYYTNEENGQWQGNGVIVDTGVGGGIVGSGDAGFQPPLYPHPHQTGYVMSGPGYYPAPPYAAPPPNDFSDYMWMENEEEFDKQVMQQLEEEALMEECIEAMLEDERRERNRSRHGGGGRAASLEQAVSRSTLNPLAAEFVPSFTPRSSTSITQEKEKPPEPAAASTKDDKPFEVADNVETIVTSHNHEVTNKHETSPPQTTATTVNQTEAPTDEPSVPAISPATTTDSQTDATVKHKSDAKKGTKGDVVAATAKAKSKPHSAKSEPKVATISKADAPQTKREAKTSRSEELLAEQVTESTVVVAPIEFRCELPPAPLEESAFKPINYAAAAKANKPKKATTPPVVVVEKSQTNIHQTNSVRTSASAAKTDIRSEKPTPREKLASAPKSAKSTEKLRKNSTK